MWLCLGATDIYEKILFPMTLYLFLVLDIVNWQRCVLLSQWVPLKTQPSNAPIGSIECNVATVEKIFFKRKIPCLLACAAPYNELKYTMCIYFHISRRGYATPYVVVGQCMQSTATHYAVNSCVLSILQV